MRMNRNSFRYFVGTLIATLALAASAFAQSSQQAVPSNIKIKNFGQMDERFYRGAQPKEEDYKSLAALGIKTVIDLQAEPKGYEKRIVESLGMRYINIPMVDKAYPTDEWINTFLKTVDDPTTGKFYVHCAGGRHRTGIMGAVYRFTHYHWNYDQVYNEMKTYDFYSSWGHGDQKKFVEDYWSKVQAANTTSAGAKTAF
jgi:protein tyrosine/serine phosphatase